MKTTKNDTKVSTEEKSKGSFKDRREKCLSKLNTVPTVNIKGKQYSTVAERHRFLLKYFPETRIDEQIVFQDEKRVITKTTLYIGESFCDHWRIFRLPMLFHNSNAEKVIFYKM